MKIILSSDESKFFKVETELVQFSNKARLIRSIKRFLFYFATSLASIFVPVLHFFLVPVFLILSIYVPLKAYKFKFMLEFKKPHLCFGCQKQLNSFYLLNDGLKFKCSDCGSHYLVVSNR